MAYEDAKCYRHDKPFLWNWLVFGSELCEGIPKDRPPAPDPFLQTLQYPYSWFYTTKRGAATRDLMLKRYGSIEEGLQHSVKVYHPGPLEYAREQGWICKSCSGCGKCIEDILDSVRKFGDPDDNKRRH